MIGLAAKAGKLTYGCQLICTAIRSGKKPAIVVLTNSASANTEKRITNCCSFYDCKLLKGDFNADDLGHITGKQGPIACVGINDQGFATEIEKRIKEALSNKETI